MMHLALRGIAVSALAASIFACSSSSTTSFSSTGSSTSSSKSSSGTKGSSGSGSSTSSSFGTSTPTDFCESLLQAESGLLSKCLGGAEASWAASIGPLAPCSEIAAAVSANRVTFDESQAASCIAAYPSLTCSTTTTVPAACASALAGAVANGSSCQSAIDCASGSFCKASTSSPCKGTCTSAIADGDSCGTGDVCASGDVCAGGTCTAAAASSGPAGKGGACGFDSSTSTLTACQVGLSCDVTTKVCVTTVAEGGACSDGAGVCAPFTYCNPTAKKCEPNPGVGGPCGAAAGQDVIYCAPGTYCAVTTGAAGKCAPLLAEGAACTSASQCSSNLCSGADGGSGTCLAACTEE